MMDYRNRVLGYILHKETTATRRPKVFFFFFFEENYLDSLHTCQQVLNNIRLASAKSDHSANKSRVVSNKNFKALSIT